MERKRIPRRPLPEVVNPVLEREAEEPEQIDWEDPKAVEKSCKKLERRRKAHEEEDRKWGIERDSKGNIKSIKNISIPRGD